MTYNMDIHEEGKNAFNLLVEKIENEGTGGTVMSEVKAFTSK